MTQRISDLLLSNLSKFIAGRMGLSFPEERRHDLERGISSAAREFGFQEVETCARWLLSSSLTKGEIEILASHLTVGETYFFRENKSFEMLREQVLPKLICSRWETGRDLRIWSAGCCTGEEPYSIAILLHQMLPNLQDWNISILATDINPRFLQKASEGVFSNWSFRGVPQPVQEKYFNRTEEGRFELLPHVKKMVTFSNLNLAEDVYPSLWNHTNAMDIIFCRNVLMYFASQRVKEVIQNLYRSLVDGGWLIVSPSELSNTLFSPLVTVAFPTVTFYRRESRQAQKADVLPECPSAETVVWAQPASTPVTIPEADPAIDFHDISVLAVEDAKEIAIPRTSYQDALALYEQGCYEGASETLLASLTADQDDAKTMVLLARVYADQGQLREALKWCEKAIVIDKLCEDAHYLQAIILQEQGALEEAESSLKRTLYLDSDFVLAHFALGNLTLKRGKVRESLKHLENALSLLEAYKPADLLPGSEGVTAGSLSEVIRSTISCQSSV